MDTACFEDYIENALQQWRVPGAAIGIVKNNQLIYSKGFGVKKLGAADLVNDHTLFPIGSISKAFSSAAIAMLVDKGKIAWESRVVDYLPDFQFYDPWVTREFQVVDIFCHRSGIAAHALTQMATWGYNASDILDALKHTKPVSSFRTAYAYNNSTYLIAERLVQQCSGIPYSDFLQERIFKSLGMNSSCTHLKALESSSNAITGHILDEETKSKVCSTDFSDCANTYIAAAGVLSTVSDLAKWMMFHLNLGRFNSQTIVSAANITKTHTPHITIEPHMFCGLGWRISHDRPYQSIAHGGVIQGIRTILTFVPKLNTGIIILTNLTDGDFPAAIATRFLDDVMNLPKKDHSSLLYQEFLKKPKSNVPSVDKNLIVPFERYVGVYSSPILGNLTVNHETGNLNFTMGRSQKATAELHPIAPDTFNICFTGRCGRDVGEANWGTAYFETNENSQVCQLKMVAYPRFDDEIFVFERLKRTLSK